MVFDRELHLTPCNRSFCLHQPRAAGTAGALTRSIVIVRGTAMSDDSTVARRELLLGALEKYARQGNFQLFRAGEWILVHRVAEADTLAEAQARMAPADVARWNAARNAMFQQVIGHLDVRTS
jgi:hypothetical protein